jgi:hypothetical protein
MRRAFHATLTAIIAVFCGCSSGNDSATVLDSSGKHPSGWVVQANGGEHPGFYFSQSDSCVQCHGSDLNGGTSKVSCFSASRSGITCHAGGPSGHPVGWFNPDAHGKAAKALLAGMNGFARCQVCHGTDFSGGTAKKTCLNTAGCHGANIFSPHSPSPWRDVESTGARTHASTDNSNAPVCAICHLSPAAPAGTPPDCFNNTLCHGAKGHDTNLPYPGALHSAAGAVRANCICHDTTTPGGTYPAAPGVAPPCSGCHLNMTNFLGANPGCWDCHGASATDGRPNGGSFPNRQASHQSGAHDDSANNCTTYCHPYSTGSPSHGWSNRTKSTNAAVNPSLNWVPGSRSNSGSCVIFCHPNGKSPCYP